MKSATVFTVLSSLFIMATASAGPTEKNKEPFLLSFVAGEYAIVGQYPDSSVAYSGVARIEKTGDRLLLTRQTGQKTVKAYGGIEVPRPPGEGSIVRFRWTDREPVVMTCLVNGDLDNYARLTCYVVPEGRPHTKPGIEALFPTATWPKKTPRALPPPANPAADR